MFCLEAKDAMPADPEEVAEAQAEQVQLHCGWGPKEILTENGKVTGVVFKRCVSVLNAEGRFAPVYNEADTMTVACEQVILSIGQSILWGNLLEGSKVELAGGGRADLPDRPARRVRGRRRVHRPRLCHRGHRRRQGGRGVHPPLRPATHQPHHRPQPAGLHPAG